MAVPVFPILNEPLLISQLLRLCVASEMHRPSGLFERGPERCLILAPTHQSVLDPFVIMSALRYRQWRVLVPVRTLATQTFRRAPLTWLTVLIGFQEALLQETQRAGKIGGRFRLPDWCRGSRPERLDALLASYRPRGLFPSFPFGTDLTSEEVVLKKALETLKQIIEQKRMPLPVLSGR